MSKSSLTYGGASWVEFPKDSSGFCSSNVPCSARNPNGYCTLTGGCINSAFIYKVQTELTEILDEKEEEKMLVARKSERVYLVEFNSYTNCSKDCVAKYSEDGSTLKSEYIEIPKEGLVVRESELGEYIKFGGGFASTKCIGAIYTKSPTENK